MNWFSEVVPTEFIGLAGGGLCVIGGVFLAFLIAVTVLTVRALRRERRSEDSDAAE